jgi:uncharacterized membrane protein
MSPATAVSVDPAIGQPATAGAGATRITSIDALRGLVMLLMLAEVMRLWTLQRA